MKAAGALRGLPRVARSPLQTWEGEERTQRKGREGKEPQTSYCDWPFKSEKEGQESPEKEKLGPLADTPLSRRKQKRLERKASSALGQCRHSRRELCRLYAPFRESSAAFGASLAPFSCFDRILSDGGFMRMPLRTRISIPSDAASG